MNMSNLAPKIVPNIVPNIVIVRHGATPWTTTGQHTGATDIDLSEEGIQQALAVGDALRSRDFEIVLTSPLLRASSTCTLAGFGAQANTDPDLIEWNYGDYEGLTSAQIAAINPAWSLWDDGAPNGDIGFLSR